MGCGKLWTLGRAEGDGAAAAVASALRARIPWLLRSCARVVFTVVGFNIGVKTGRSLSGAESVTALEYRA